MNLKSTLAATAIFLATTPLAAQPLIGTYEVTQLHSVYDGDTFTASVQVWVNQSNKVSVRVRGVDTPEIRGKCQSEKDLAVQAREAAKEFLNNGTITLSDVDLGKYAGRVVASVEVDGKRLDEYLVSKSLGRPYNGGKREGWCN